MVDRSSPRASPVGLRAQWGYSRSLVTARSRHDLVDPRERLTVGTPPLTSIVVVVSGSSSTRCTRRLPCWTSARAKWNHASAIDASIVSMQHQPPEGRTIATKTFMQIFSGTVGPDYASRVRRPVSASWVDRSPQAVCPHEGCSSLSGQRACP